MRSGLIRAHCAVRCLDTVPVFQQWPFPGPYQAGMNLVFTQKLASRLAAFKRLQRNPKLEGRRVSSPFLDHRAASPQVWCIAPLYTLARGPVFGAKLKRRRANL